MGLEPKQGNIHCATKCQQSMYCEGKPGQKPNLRDFLFSQQERRVWYQALCRIFTVFYRQEYFRCLLLKRKQQDQWCIAKRFLYYYFCSTACIMIVTFLYSSQLLIFSPHSLAVCCVPRFDRCLEIFCSTSCFFSQQTPAPLWMDSLYKQ